MEISMAYPASKFEADNTLTNPVVLEKYQLAADIVNGTKRTLFCLSSYWFHFDLGVLPAVVSKVETGISVCDLCQFGDDLLTAYVSSNQSTGIRVNANRSNQHVDRKDVQELWKRYCRSHLCICQQSRSIFFTSCREWHQLEAWRCRQDVSVYKRST